MPPEPPEPPEPLLTQAGRPARNYRVPRKFQDCLPETPVSVEATVPVQATVKRVILHVRDSFRTTVNRFGVLREYLHRPSYDPDASVKPEDLANFKVPPDSTAHLPDAQPNLGFLPPWPFKNMSRYLLMNWYQTGSSQKTEQELNRLVKDVIGNPEFNVADLAGFSASRENKQLDNAGVVAEAPFLDDGWREVTVEIEIPVPQKNTIPKRFPVPGLHHRSIMEVLRATWGAATSLPFHFTPFRRIHVDPITGEETRLFDEVYTSEAFELAHNQLQKQPPEPGCELERVIAGLMFWSDATRVANFGTASVWPLYMYFANLSKYVRAKPTSGACHHIAYIPSVRQVDFKFILPDMRPVIAPRLSWRLHIHFHTNTESKDGGYQTPSPRTYASGVATTLRRGIHGSLHTWHCSSMC